MPPCQDTPVCRRQVVLLWLQEGSEDNDGHVRNNLSKDLMAIHNERVTRGMFLSIRLDMDKAERDDPIAKMFISA